MRAARLLAYLQSHGVRFQVVDGRLKFKAPKGVITPDIREELSQYKPELISLLKAAAEDSGSDLSVQQAAGTSEAPLLSFAQERLWFFEQLEQNSSVYNVPVAVHIRGQLNTGSLEQALNEIIRRHAVLRTSCETVDGKPVQTVLKGVKINMPLKDLQGIPETERLSVAKNMATEEACRPFNLSQVPLLRTCLFKLAAEEYLFLLVTHHFAIDGWSMGILCEELSTLYDDYSHNSSSSLPDLSIQYAEAVLWQRQQLTGDRLEKTLRFWQQQLDNAPSALKLFSDRPRPAVETYRGKTMDFLIPLSLSGQLKELSRNQGVTLFMTLMAALHALLYRYTGQNNILAATAVSNRNRSDFEGIIGSFMNIIIIRADCSDGPAFLELLQQVKETAVDAFAHQDLPFEKLLREMQSERDLGRNPLFQVLFTLHRFSQQQELLLPGLSQKRIDIEKGTSMLDLSLSILDREDGLSASFEYNTDLFDAATIKRMAGHYQKILEGIGSNPDQRVSELPLLNEAEKYQLLVEWNTTSSDYPGEKLVYELFKEQVERTPDSIAVVFENQQLTYRELNSRANQLAGYLRNLGVGPEVLVGICVERSLEMVVGLLGILKAGGAYVPLDPVYPRERLKLMLEDTDISILLTKARLISELPKVKAKSVCLDTDWNDISRESDKNPDIVVMPNNAAYVIYTSGSTGKPKGTVVEHGSLGNYTRAAVSQYGITQSDRILQFASISFDASVEEIFPCLAQGATLVLRTDDMMNSTYTFLNKCVEWKLTFLSLPTAYWHELTLGLDTDNLRMPDSIRILIIGGEQASSESLVRWNRHVDINVRLLNTYGPTEATVVATMYDLTHMVNPEHTKAIPIGYPMPNVQIYILDRHLQPVPIGVTGELHIGGCCLARGYLNRQGLTSEKFIPNPFKEESGERLYKSGDLARYLPDGNIEFLGRTDEQVKIRGFRIEPGEIEAVLRQHPDIKEVVVIAKEASSGDKRLAAYIVLNPISNTNASELRSFLQKKLPDYMIPNEFDVLDSMPLTAGGKIDRESLPEPDSVRLGPGSTYAAPQSSIDKLLAGIWCQVLDIRQVGIHDNFFALGGHSLLATQVVSRLNNEFNIDLPLRRLFEMPTIEGLAGEVSRLFEEKEEPSESLIVPVLRVGELPLSFSQQRLWFLDQLEPDSSAYNIAIALRMNGNVNAAVLEKSIREILRRHDVLRTSFHTYQDQPVQKIAPAAAFTLERIDLSVMPEKQRETKAGQIAKEEASRPFNLTVGSLLRATLIKIKPEEHILILNIHHIVSDGWSMVIFYQELSRLYEAYLLGNPSPLPDLPIQYADFAVWQRKWLQSEKLDEQLTFWRKRLRDIVTLELPTDHPRPAVQTYNGSKHTLQLSKELTASLKELNRKERVTLFMTLLTAFQVLLHRYTGQDDIVVGTPIANRNRAEIEELIGFFVNTLVMRADMSGNPVFRELLKDARKTLLDAYTHQDIPFEKLVEELKPNRDMGRNPLFQVGFALQNIPFTKLDFSGLSMNRMDIDDVRSKFDLDLSIEEGGEGLRGTFVYNTDLFDATTIERMACHYRIILEGIVADPEQRLSELPLLTETERHQLLVEWNDTSRVYTGDKCIHDMFEACAVQTPDAVAVVFEGQQLTYRELNAKANQLAQYLIKQGVAPEMPVGICVDRSLDMIVGLMGILKSGGAYVPLDPLYPRERLSFMIEDAGITLMLSHKSLNDKLPEVRGNVICLDDDWRTIGRESVENPSENAGPDKMAYIMFTSGSTGRPKGVVITHNNVVGFLSSYKHVALDGNSRIGTSVAPFSFDTSVEEIFSNLCYGGTLHIIRPENSSDVAYFADYLVDNKITTTYIVPDFLSGVAARLENRKDRLNLKCVITGLRPKKQAALQCIRDLSDDIRILNAYGPTEVTYGATAFEFHHADDPDRDTPIGRPFPNYEVYIVDSHLQPVPIGVSGELLIGGVGLARGYLNRPELTLEKFIPHPFKDKSGLRLYRSGDLVRYLPDGNIEFLGRIDDQVKIRGYRVEPGEVEAVLGQHPDIKETAVIAGDDNAGGKRLVAYYVSVQKKRIPIGELRNELLKKLPEYMVPSAFVMLDVLPRMSNGKIDRRALPEPDTDRPDIEDEFISPRTPTEELLAVIWNELLGLRQVGIYDNFFKLGGHSLLATQIVSRLRKDFNVDMPLRRLFEMPTIAGLAEEISRLDADKVQSPELVILPVSREGKLPLSFSQQRLWFLDQLEPSSSAYNITSALRLTGHLNAAALEQSIAEIIRRHEVLRTTFSTENDEPVQRIHPAGAFTLQRVDISKIPESQREAEAQRIVREETSRVFDLNSGPLLRAVLVRLKQEDHVLIFVLHHIVSDAWSAGIFFRELSELYEAFLKGIPSALPDLPIQYADYAVWQHKWLQGEKLEEQIKFWKDYLEDVAILELPTDRPRPAVQTFNGSKQFFQLPGDLTKALQALSRREHVTIFMTTLTAFQSLLHRYTGQNDIVIGTPIANRIRAETDGLIGFFLNTLVIRADTSGNPAFRKMLSRVRKVLLDAYTYQDLPFEKLVEELQPERDLSRNPLFHVLFTLQNITNLDLEQSGLSVSWMDVGNTRTRFDLEVHLEEGDGGLKGAFVYNTDLFDAATIERMVRHYEKMLEGIAADPDQKLSDLPLLTDAERHQLLVEWNESSAEYPGDMCIHELFEEQVEMNSDAAAVVFKDQRLTYKELNRKANQLAHYLRKQGVGPGAPVGICIERSLEMIISVLGILKAGGAYVPLDPAYPKERLGFMLEDAGVRLVITQNSLSGELPEGKVKLLLVDQDREIIEKESDQNPFTTALPQALAYVLYTSGSTGKPKGVAMSHRPLCNLISWQLRSSRLSSGAKTLQFASLNFDVSFQEIFSTLCSGGTLTVVSEELRREPLFLSRYLENESIERLFLPFVALQQLAEAMDKSNSFPRSLKEIITAGEQLRITPSIARMFEGLVACRLYNQYGPTESHVVTSFELSGPPSEWPSLPPIGRPISNARIYLLDRNHKPVALGIVGELCIGGECLAHGYMNRPELTAERFITNPFSQEPGNRLYKTGDLARYLADGNIEYLGRLDHQVKVRGYRIEPGEIETVLAQHHEVKDTVVTTYGDRIDNKRLVAYVVRDRKSTITTGELRNFLSEKLPEYMVPSAFMLLEGFPLTPSGKVDRRSLPAPDRDSAESAADFVPPGDKLEIQLAKIWEKVLDVKRVGITDNFFHLGGHSLLAVPLISEINKVTGKNLPVISIFHAPTIVQLVKVILGEELPGPSDSIAPVQPHGSHVPIFWLTGTYFVRHMEPDQPVYMLIDWDEHGFIPGYSTIEEIAALCIERLVAERPEGPYVLGGYCFWGAVALEIAQQLIRQGHEVPLLFLVDTSVKYTSSKPKGSDHEQKSSTMKSRIIHHSGSIQRLGSAGKVLYVLQKFPSIVNWVKGKTIDRLIRKTKVAICRTFIFFGRPVPRALIPFYLYNLYAYKLLNKYIPQDYPGRVVLISSDREDRVVRPDWLDLVKGEVYVHTVSDAKHTDLINEPYVSIWAKLLNKYLRRTEV